MIYTQKIQQAIVFSIKTHELDQKQKRKGKDIPYIAHPLTVGLILSRAGADENTVAAGILHDTIEDSTAENKVTEQMIEERFGKEVANLVASVSETDKGISWEERKRKALEHVETYSHNSLLVKSADIISNSTELIDDYKHDGDAVFARFNAPKEAILQKSLLMITAILGRWPESPLSDDLKSAGHGLRLIAGNAAGHSDSNIGNADSTNTFSGDEFLRIGAVAKSFFEKIPSSETPEFVIFMGGIGSGKTTLRREKFSDGYVNFDSGEIGDAVGVLVGKNHTRFIDYSLLASSIILRECILEKKNIVIEIIGDNYEQITPVIEKMRGAGYSIQLIPVYCDIEEARKRHLHATKEDKNYNSSYYSQDLTLLNFFNYFNLGEMPTIAGETL